MTSYASLSNHFDAESVEYFVMKILLALFWTSILFLTVQAQKCGCVALKDEEITRQGYGATPVYEENKTYKSIHGTAVIGTNNTPLKDVFVELFVFDSKENKLNRIVGCRTATNGKFCFPKLLQGKYTIQLSKDGGYMITKIIVNVSPKSKFDREITGIVRLRDKHLQ